jgi:hypothetical protein
MTRDPDSIRTIVIIWPIIGGRIIPPVVNRRRPDPERRRRKKEPEMAVMVSMPG